MTGRVWTALVLAAGRGPDDPMAKAFGVSHKCRIAVGGVPMLERVVSALGQAAQMGPIAVAIEAGEPAGTGAIPVSSQDSAPQSVLHALDTGAVAFPLLVTTGDHALLTPEMIDWFLKAAEATPCDLAVGLASAETVLATWPQTKRTWLTFGPDRVSGCNLFALKSHKARKALEMWRYLERVRKKPWRLVAAFGPVALFQFLTRQLTLEKAFVRASARLGISVRPILLPFAEASIDVDKPADKELAEEILALRVRNQQHTITPI